MSFFFSQKRPKTINEIVYALNEWVRRIGDGPPKSPANSPHVAARTPSGDEYVMTAEQKQAAEEAGRLLAQLRKCISVHDKSSHTEHDVDLLTSMAKEVYATEVLVPLVLNLWALDFDARNNTSNLFSVLIQRLPTVDYLLHKIPEIFVIMMQNAGTPEIHRTVCHMLRDCAHHEPLATYIMNSQSFWWFFQYMDHPEFEVATDNFATFQDFMQSFPELESRFVQRNPEYFMQCVNGLIRSQNYVAKRQALRMLCRIMRHQRNQQFLLYYVKHTENLKLIMRLLKDKSKNIHFEAFQIFKLIVVNPNKPQEILEILIRNKQKLLQMIDDNRKLSDQRENQDFQRQRDYVRARISNLPDIPPSGRPRAEPATPLGPSNPPGYAAVTGATRSHEPRNHRAGAEDFDPARPPVPQRSRQKGASRAIHHSPNQGNSPYAPLHQPSPLSATAVNQKPSNLSQLAPTQLAPRLAPQPSTHLQPQLTAPQLVHRPSSPSRAQIPPNAQVPPSVQNLDISGRDRA